MEQIKPCEHEFILKPVRRRLFDEINGFFYSETIYMFCCRKCGIRRKEIDGKDEIDESTKDM